MELGGIKDTLRAFPQSVSPAAALHGQGLFLKQLIFLLIIFGIGLAFLEVRGFRIGQGFN